LPVAAATTGRFRPAKSCGHIVSAAAAAPLLCGNDDQWNFIPGLIERE
jgi:hypothetical protein